MQIICKLYFFRQCSYSATPIRPYRPLPTAEMHSPAHHTTHTRSNGDRCADSDTTVSDTLRSFSVSLVPASRTRDDEGDDSLDCLRETPWRETRPTPTSSMRSLAPSSPAVTVWHTLPTTQTTAERPDPVTILRAECMRAERILAGAQIDDGAGVQEDPRVRLLVYQRRLAHLRPCSSGLSDKDANVLPSSPPAARPHAPISTFLHDLNDDGSKNALSPFSTPLCLFSRKSQILLLLSYLFYTYFLYSIVF